MSELSQEMNKQFKVAEKRHRQLQEKVTAAEHKVDSGVAGLNSKIAGLEAQLKAATDAQAAALAQLQAEIRSVRAGSFSDPVGSSRPGAVDGRPSHPGIPPRDSRTPYAAERLSDVVLPFSVTPAHKKQTFARISEEVMPHVLRADAVPKYGLSATAMRIEFSDKDATHSFADLFPGRVYTYIDKGSGERADVNVGISRSQPRRAVGAAFRPYFSMLLRHGYTRETVIQRYIETDVVWSNIVLLAQKGGRAAELGRFTFAFEGTRAYLFLRSWRSVADDEGYRRGVGHAGGGHRGHCVTEDSHRRAAGCAASGWMSASARCTCGVIAATLATTSVKSRDLEFSLPPRRAAHIATSVEA